MVPEWKNLCIKDLEVLFQARGEERPPSSGRDKKKRILEQWEVVKELPVTCKPWMEANNKELKELLHNCGTAGLKKARGGGEGPIFLSSP